MSWPRALGFGVLAAAAVWACVVFWHALFHFMGLDSGAGPWYLFHSGFGANLGEYAIVAGLIGVLRKHNCEVHRCWRIGRHATEAGHMVCRKHHPDGHLTAEQVIIAHCEALERRLHLKGLIHAAQGSGGAAHVPDAQGAEVGESGGGGAGGVGDRAGADAG